MFSAIFFAILAHSFPNNDPLKEEKHEEKSVSLLCLVDVGGLRRAGAVSFQTHEDKTMHAGQGTFSYNYASGYNFSPLVWAMGGGDIRVTMSQYTITWEAKSDGYIYYSIKGTYNLHFLDTFTEPLDIPGVEWGTIYSYYDIWKNLTIDLTGRILE